jgi:hypothetical protein
MTPDPKWLEILKASGLQTAAIAAACALFLLLARLGWLPPLEPWMIIIATFVLVLCGFLTIAAILSSTLFKKWMKYLKDKRAVREYIPYMTAKEREIISYLLAKKKKTFFYTIDGGYAATLISRGIVICALKPGQTGSTWHIPFIIPDHIWSVLLKNKKEFPYNAPQSEKNEVAPWAIPWAAR